MGLYRRAISYTLVIFIFLKKFFERNKEEDNDGAGGAQLDYRLGEKLLGPTHQHTHTTGLNDTQQLRWYGVVVVASSSSSGIYYWLWVSTRPHHLVWG